MRRGSGGGALDAPAALVDGSWKQSAHAAPAWDATSLSVAPNGQAEVHRVLVVGVRPCMLIRQIPVAGSEFRHSFAQ